MLCRGQSPWAVAVYKARITDPNLVRKDLRLEPGFPGVRRRKRRGMNELVRLAYDVRFML